MTSKIKAAFILCFFLTIALFQQSGQQPILAAEIASSPIPAVTEPPLEELPAAETFAVEILPDESPSPAMTQAPITELLLSDTKLFLAQGSSKTLKVIQMPENFTMGVIFSSSDQSIAIVDQDGLITAVGPGEATIMAYLYGDYSAYCTVTVGEPVAEILLPSVSNQPLTLELDQQYKLEYSLLPYNAVNTEIIFSSSPSSIIEVAKDGTITAKKPGKTTLTLSANDESKVQTSVTIVVNEAASNKKAPNINRKTLPYLHIVDISKAKYTYQEMRSDLEELEEVYGDRMKVATLGTSYDSRNIYEVTLGNPDSEKQVFIQSSIHAREHMTTLLTMRQLEYYCQNYYSGTYDGYYLNELFEEVCFRIIPMSNPDGVTISQFGPSAIRNSALRAKVTAIGNKYGFGNSYYYTRWKANARGVDLNRNFDGRWDLLKSTAKAPCNAGYPGTEAVSEKESQILVNRVNELNPAAVISYHSTGSILYWYFGQSGTLYNRSAKLVNTIAGLTSYRKIYNYSKYESAGFGDWVSIKKKIPTVTVEIGTSACPLGIREFPSIWNKNKSVPAAIALLYLD